MTVVSMFHALNDWRRPRGVRGGGRFSVIFVKRYYRRETGENQNVLVDDQAEC
jgi:hypothetical protein